MSRRSSSDGHLFVVSASPSDAVLSLLLSLFRCDRIVKLGFGLRGDVRRLRESYPHAAPFQSDVMVNTFDVADCAFSRGRGLAAVAALVCYATAYSYRIYYHWVHYTPLPWGVFCDL